MNSHRFLFGSLVTMILTTSALGADVPPAPIASGAAAIAKASPAPDTALIEVFSKQPTDEALAADSSVTAALAATESDTETLLKLYEAFSMQPSFNAITVATIEASARRAAAEAEKPERVEAILLAIDRIQPGMNKFAWRSGMESLKAYSDLLAVYVDNCPTDHPVLGKRLADVQMRHITAACITLPPAESLKRLNAIDPNKLSRDKDRDQLDMLKMRTLAQDNRFAEAGTHAQAIWSRPQSQFRGEAWHYLFESLLVTQKKAEAEALLNEVAKDPKYASEIAEYRARLNSMLPGPTTQP